MLEEKHPSGRKEGVSTSHKLITTFFAGGVAGCCAKSVVAPFDRVKILLQAHNQHYKHLGVFSTVKHVIHKEGYSGLFKGNGTQMIRIFPYAAIQFTAYEHYKKKLKYVLSNHTDVTNLFSGSLAGITAVLFTYPLDIVRARLAFQVTGEHIYSGIAHTFKCILVDEGGLKGLYKGIVPTVVGMAPYAGFSFYGFATLKRLSLEYFPEWCGKPCLENTGGLVLIIPAKLLCGGMAGAFAQTISYPLDVARRRIQLALMTPESHKFTRGWLQTLVVVYHDDGIKHGLFRGLSINYIRVIPSVAVSFSVYETLKQHFHLDTGINR